MNKQIKKIEIIKKNNKLFLIRIYDDNSVEKQIIKEKYYGHLLNLLVCIELDLL